MKLSKSLLRIRELESRPTRLSKLGEPFYSNKEKGTGLGLMVSYKIIENHHGSIRFISKEGFGTTVEIRLPIENLTVEIDFLHDSGFNQTDGLSFHYVA